MDADRLGWLTLGDVASRLGCQLWHIQRLFARGLLPQPVRLARVRVVRAHELPIIRAALVEAGYVKGDS